MAFMQSLIASSEACADTAPVSMLARICVSAVADVTGASVKERAIRIAKMARMWCRVSEPFKCQGIMNGLAKASRHGLMIAAALIWTWSAARAPSGEAQSTVGCNHSVGSG